MTKRKTTSVYLSIELWEKVKDYAWERREKMCHILERALKTEMDKTNMIPTPKED